jgi:large subunit ribosomal protein L15
MRLGDLKPAKGATKTRKRLGRGPGSGRGSTSTKGTKGQLSRAGHRRKPWFEGGQMPLQRRVPKRGFTNIHARPVEAINVRDLVPLAGQTITAELLHERGLVRDAKAKIKILGYGELTVAVTVHAHAVTESARKKIEASGGRVELIEVPRRPARFSKKERKVKE